MEVESAQINLYDNGILVNNQETGTIYSAGLNRLTSGIEWTPTIPGNRTLKIEIIAPEDVNSSNNQLEKEYYVYEKTNVTIRLRDNQNNPVTRYIYAEIFSEGNEDESPIKIEGEKTIISANLSETGNTFGLGVYQIDGEYLNSISKGIMLMTINSSFNGNINIISEVYNKTTDDDRDYYAVFANRISTALKTQNYGMAFNKSFLKKIGIKNISRDYNEEGETITGDYDFVYCREFDFTNKKCAGVWEKGKIMDIDEYQETIAIIGEANCTIEAFGLTSFTGFDGSTTNFSEETDMISNFTIERTSYGKIKFKSPVNISRFKSNEELLTYYASIGIGKISINTDNLPELSNKKADLIFWNINMHNPQLMRDGEECPETICTNTAYDSNTKTFVANVNRFSSFEIEEGPYCGDGTCQESEGEECDVCVADCDTCDDDDDDGSSPSSSSSSIGTPSCNPSWNCTWGPCVNSLQKYVCTDKNKCGTTRGKPAEQSRSCLIESDCTDNDGDGYGTGADCLGPDINDNDPGITDTQPSLETESENTGEEKMIDYIKENLVYIIIGVILLAVIIIVAIIIFILFSKKKRH